MSSLATLDKYADEAERLLGRISGDCSVSDIDFVELCEEIADNFRTAARAKQEELDR